MRNIILGYDHRGKEIKAAVIKCLEKLELKLKFDIIDTCMNDEGCTDYPSIANNVCQSIEKDDMGILICNTGTGMAMAANKFEHIRAVQGHSEDIAKLSRQHNNANVLCLGTLNEINEKGRVNEEELYQKIKIFLSTSHSNEERHIRRVKQMSISEKKRKKK
ncbi:Ribose/Galactose Isomerase [seawater metagenome]|uniref:Ribose/Galactose Isomerase n=1 Tax=seawater metagenome TaxID=1561972 RepID=A0A5E8CGL0_9ZZZZ